MVKRVYIFGDPVAHSKSPAMHTAAYRELNLDYEYIKEHVRASELADKVKNLLRYPNCAGANITVPHKEQVLPFLDELDPLARKFGAVNTIVNDHGRLKGYNTDGSGYVRSLLVENGFSVAGKKVAMFGAGGAAKAIALSLEDFSDLAIGEVVQNKAETLASQIANAKAYQADSQEFLEKVHAADLVINTTPLGMHPREDKTPLTDLAVIHSGQLYSDIVYIPQETLFLRNASAKGAQVHFGWGMLLFQGVLAFSYFTGVPLDKIPVDTMKKALFSK